MTCICLMLPSIEFHASWHKTNMTIAWELVVTWSSFGAGRAGCCYKTMPPVHRSVLVQVDLAKQQATVCNTLNIHIISHMQFIFLSLLEKNAMLASISVRQGKPYSTSWKYLSAVFPAALHHWQTCRVANGDYFEGRCGYVEVYVSIL